MIHSVVGGDVPPAGFAGSVANFANLPGGQRARVMQDRQAGSHVNGSSAVPRQRRAHAGTARLILAASQKKDTGSMAIAKPLGFEVGDYVVYPKHGVGRVVEIQSQHIAGASLDLFVLRFEKERMTLRVPTNKAEGVGMRKLSSQATMNEALTTLKGKPRIKRTMWSRRAQEYEAKINSGDLVSIAEVVRDLHRAEDQPEQSYSERQIYEAAIGRLARELAAMENIDEPAAQQKIEQVLKAA
jgi:CarD family transcriptional regulator